MRLEVVQHPNEAAAKRAQLSDIKLFSGPRDRMAHAGDAFQRLRNRARVQSASLRPTSFQPPESAHIRRVQAKARAPRPERSALYLNRQNPAKLEAFSGFWRYDGSGERRKALSDRYAHPDAQN